MPRLSIDKNPKLRWHSAADHSVVTLSGHDHYLGRWPEGKRKLPAAGHAEYDRLISEWRANGRRPIQSSDQLVRLTVGELIVKFLAHAEQHYRRPDGSPAGEVDNLRYALRPLRKLYETLPAAEFSSLKLKAVRQLMVEGGPLLRKKVQSKLCRSLVDRRIGKIVRVFAWAVAEEMVPPDVAYGLRETKGLGYGRREARESQSPPLPMPSWKPRCLSCLPPSRRWSGVSD